MGEANLIGAWGEALAAQYLRKKGYTILARGYRCRMGEIDLIARKRRMLIFVEVKTRKNADFAMAREYVDFRKQERLRRAAAMYLAANPTEIPARFDVIEIYAPEGIHTTAPVLNHLEDAFQ